MEIRNVIKVSLSGATCRFSFSIPPSSRTFSPFLHAFFTGSRESLRLSPRSLSTRRLFFPSSVLFRALLSRSRLRSFSTSFLIIFHSPRASPSHGAPRLSALKMKGGRLAKGANPTGLATARSTSTFLRYYWGIKIRVCRAKN